VLAVARACGETGSALDAQTIKDIFKRHNIESVVHSMGMLVDSSAPAPLRQVYQVPTRLPFYNQDFPNPNPNPKIALQSVWPRQ
jgi:hypothetical protein